MFDELVMLHADLRLTNRAMAVQRCSNVKPFLSDRIQDAIDEGLVYVDDGMGSMLPQFRLTETGAESMADMECCLMESY